MVPAGTGASLNVRVNPEIVDHRARVATEGVDAAERGASPPVAAGPDGRRSTSAVGRAVLAAALRPVDERGAAAVEQATAWRSDYPAHFRRLVEAGLPDPKSWLTRVA